MQIYQLNTSNGFEQFVQESDAIARQQKTGGTIEVIEKPDPDAANLETAKAIAIQTARQAAKDAQDQFVAAYSSAEQATWTRKEDEARKYGVSGDANDAPTLKREADEQAKSLEEICAIILANADNWNQLQAAIVAWRGNTIAAINAAQSLEVLESISLTPPSP